MAEQNRTMDSLTAEIIGPDGRVHYRRPPDHPMCDEARATPGYTVRLVSMATIAGLLKPLPQDNADALWGHK